MDLRQYFRKLRDIESGLVDAYPVVISLETSDGGRDGVVSEVSRETAAKLIMEGRAVLASEQQKEDFLLHLEIRKKAAEKLELSRRVQVAIIADPDLHSSVVSKKSPSQGNGK